MTFRWGETYTWTNVNCVVHNVIVGSLWMEHVGAMEINCEQSGLRTVLSFKPGQKIKFIFSCIKATLNVFFSGGYFKSKDELHHVEGFLLKGKEKKKFLFGNWTETFCSAPVEALEEAFGVKSEKVRFS